MPTGVTVHVVRAGQLRDVASAPGVVVPASAFDLLVSAPEAGQVVEIGKKETDRVATGDMLVRFDIPSVTQELAARQLEVLELTTRVDRARAETARLSDLVGRGLVPRNNYETARSQQAANESALAQATAQFEAAKTGQDFTTVRAHFPGIVVKVWHAEGDSVSAGPADPVMRVIDPTHVQVAVQLPVAQLARIVPGQLATVLAFSSTGTLGAAVASKPVSTDPNAATGEVRMSFSEPATLAVDAPVSVEILLDQRTGVLWVPTAALLREGVTTSVMVVSQDRASRRPVRTGLVTKDAAEILSGLAAGDEVILTTPADLEEGEAVVVAR